MKAFTDLYTALDETTKTNEKIAAMKSYFETASPEDSAWAIYFLTGRKPKQLMQIPKLVALAVAAAGVPGWMFAESYDAVGDTAETIALLLPDSTKTSELPLSEWVENRLLPLRRATEQERVRNDAIQQEQLRRAQEMQRLPPNSGSTGGGVGPTIGTRP